MHASVCSLCTRLANGWSGRDNEVNISGTWEIMIMIAVVRRDNPSETCQKLDTRDPFNQVCTDINKQH
jgi:hypothetical protein